MANETDIQVQQKAAEIRRLLEEIAFLSKSELPTLEYFRRFLELTSRALDAPGGCVWLKTGQGYQRLCAIKFQDTEFDTNESQRQSILKVLNDAGDNRRPVVLTGFDPNAQVDENAPVLNRTRFPYFFMPILLNNQAVAVLHVWLAPETDPKLFRDFITFLQTVSNQAEIYLRARRLESLTAESQKLSQLVTLLGEMAGQVEPEKLALSIANYGREVIGADRVCVAVKRRFKTRVLAVSGVETVDKKSAMVKSVVVLANRAITSDEPRLLTKGDENAQDEEINEYFTRGNMRAAYLLPLRTREGKTMGALIAECAKPEMLGESARKLAQSVAKPAGASLGMAEDERSVPFLPTLRKLQHAKEWAMGSKKRRVQVAIAIPIALIVIFALFPWYFDVAGDCTLVTANRGVAISEVSGRIVAVPIREGASVTKGQVLAELDATELQRKLAVAKFEYDRYTAAADKYRTSKVPQEQAARAEAEIQARGAMAQVQLLEQQIEQTKIRSPIDGIVMTKELQTRIGATIERGGEFVEVGDPTRWQALVQIRENDVAPLDRRLRRGEQCEVEVLTRGWTKQVLHGSLRSITDITQLSYPPPNSQGGVNVFIATVDLNLTPDEIKVIRSGFSGRAEIGVGWSTAGILMTRRFIDYVRVNWLL